MQDETERKGIGGRKPKRPSEKQSRRAMVTFTPGEWRGLKAAAGDEPVGTFIRRLVLRYLARLRK
jgi:hypothetical protein